MKKFALVMLAVLSVLSCSDKNPKRLVLYYSQSGNSKAVAEAIAARIGADIEAFDVRTPYDGTYDETISRCLEERETGKLSPVIPIQSNLKKYDEIFLGYPVWFGTCARPVFSFMKKYDLKGKTVIPFCTFGSGGLESSVKSIRNTIQGADVKDGFGIRAARMDKLDMELRDYLARAGYTDDIYEYLKEFSLDQTVSEHTSAIFEQACSGYPIPLGTPVSVASRKRSGGMEYRFKAASQDSEGRPARSEVYVFVSDSGETEFTKVVR